MAENLSIRLDARIGDTSGIDALERRAAALRRELQESQRTLANIGAQLQRTADRTIPLRGFEALPGGGIQRVGYQGGLPPAYVQPQPPLNYTYVRPGGVRPYPATLAPPVFGPAAGGPQNVAPPANAFPAPPAAPPGQQPVTVPPSVPPTPGTAFPPPPPAPPGQRTVTPPPGVPPPPGAPFPAPPGPQGPPPPPPPEPEGPGLPSWIPKTSGGAIAAYLGYRAIRFTMQEINAGVREYEVRALATLNIGLQTEQQYGRIRQTIKGLSDEYRIMGRESAQAMHTLAYATGDALTGLGDLARTGTAYGISLPQMAQYAAARAIQGVPNANIASLLAVYHQAGPGVLPMGAQRAVEQMVQVGQVGGLTTAPMSDMQLGRMTEYMALGGGKAAMNPAEAYARQLGGISQEAGPLGEAARALGLQQRMRTNPQFTYAGRTYDLRTALGQQMFRQHGGETGELQEAYGFGARQLAGGNADLLPFVEGEALNEPDIYLAQQQLERDRQAQQRYGGPARLLRTPAPLTEQARREAERLQGRYVPGQAVLERQTIAGQVAETGAVAGVEIALNARTLLEQQLADATREHGESVKDATVRLKEFDTAMRSVVERVNSWLGLPGLTGGLGSPLPGEGVPNPVPAPGPGGWLPGEYPPQMAPDRRQPATTR